MCVNRMDKIPVCKGQCVLDKNLKQADNNEENLPDLTIKVVNDYVHVATTITFSTPAQTLFNLVKKEDFAFIPERFNSDIFHPPTYSI